MLKTLDVIVALLLVVGGLNWGLVGLLNFDVVAGLFGSMTGPARFIYALVAAGALYQLAAWKAIQRRWAYEPTRI